MSAPSFLPSFSSFPGLESEGPKAGSSKQEKSEDQSRRSHSRKHKDRDRDHERERDRDKHRKKKHRDGERKRDSDRYKDSKRKQSRTKPLDDERAKQEEDRNVRLGSSYNNGAPGLFVVDKTGDPMNVVYGGLHAGDIPRYRRDGYGNVLGLAKALKIITRGTGGKALEVGVNGRRPAARYTDRHSFTLLTTTRTRQLLPTSGNSHTDVDAQAEFIRLPSRRGRTSEEPLSTYRSILPSQDADLDSDSGASSAQGSDGESSESDAGGTGPRTAHQHALAALEIALQRDPTSLPAWFALLDETLSTVPLSAKSSLTRARAEIKLAVLDRAMRTDPRNKASVELRVRWLSAGAEVWDIEKLEKEWETAVTELGGPKRDNDGVHVKNRMWEEWLRWRASSAGKGTRKGVGIEGIMEDAVRALENVVGELVQVKILWWISVTLKGAGFSERAMAIFQAQAELTFNCPPSLTSKPLAARLGDLEEFWEAEFPRIGDADARGWDAWDRDGRMGPPEPGPSSAAPVSSSMDVDKISDPYTQWAVDESQADINSSMPKRGDDGDDPYATILFSDVRPLLVDLTTPHSQHALRIAWLSFLGLHVPGFAASLSGYDLTDGRDDVWSRSHLSRPPFLRQLFPPRGKGKERDWDAFAGTIVAREKSYGSAFGCVKEWGMGVFSPLEGVADGAGRMWEDTDAEGLDKAVIRRIFDQLRRKLNFPSDDQDSEWNVMAVAFEAATNLKSAIKLSRTLLSTARDSLPLWRAHARLERLRGKQDEARRIYETALSTHASTHGAGTLWWDWAEMEWLSGADNRAKAVIMRSAGLDPEIGGSMSILRARRTLEDRMREQEDPNEWKERESWMCLRSLLEILGGGTGAVEEAMAVMEGHIYASNLGGVPRESALVRMLLMGWRHAHVLGRQLRRRVVSEKVLKVVQEDERQGGANTAVLGVFLDGEKGESVWGRVRALVGEGVGETGEEKGLLFGRRDKSVARRVWEVWLATWERGRWDAEAERIRNSMSVGVGNERSRASANLWRVYVEFEIYSGELKRAKSLLFRAVSDCPLVKELYLLAFGPLRSVFTPRELEGWAETMAERGIRMHTSLDEHVGVGAREMSGESEGESAGEEELERAARDYRRLAPF